MGRTMEDTQADPLPDRGCGGGWKTASPPISSLLNLLVGSNNSAISQSSLNTATNSFRMHEQFLNS